MDRKAEALAEDLRMGAVRHAACGTSLQFDSPPSRGYCPRCRTYVAEELRVPPPPPP